MTIATSATVFASCAVSMLQPLSPRMLGLTTNRGGAASPVSRDPNGFIAESHPLFLWKFCACTRARGGWCGRHPSRPFPRSD